MEAVFVYTTKQIQLKVNVICSSVEKTALFETVKCFYSRLHFLASFDCGLKFKVCSDEGLRPEKSTTHQITNHRTPC